MISLAFTGPVLGCWLFAGLALSSPEYSDNYSSSSVSSQSTTLSSSMADACKVESTKTVFVTLSPASEQSTTSIPAGANVETTTITVSPVQSHAETDATADAVTTGSVPAYGPSSGSSSHTEAGHPASDASSQEFSTVSRTILATHTVTLTVAPARKGPTSTESSTASDPKSTGVSSAMTELSSNVATCITHTVVGADGRPTVVESIIVTEPAAASAFGVLGTAVPANAATATAPGIPVPSYGSTSTSGLTIHTSFTATGPDSSPTIIDTTWIIPVPPTSVMSGLNPHPSGVISSGRVVSGLPSNAASGATAESPMTSVMGTPTCTTVTVVGPDMRPTVTELTIIAPTGAPAATASNIVPPPFVAPASMTNLASQPPITSNSVVATVTWKVIGADGTVSAIIQTITAPSGSIVAGIPASLPTAVTASIPLPGATGSSGNVPFLTPYGTASFSGQNSASVVSIISGVDSVPTFVPAPSGAETSPTITAEPPAYGFDTAFPLPSYETPIGSQKTPGVSPIQDATSSSDSDWVSSILYGSFPTPTPPATPLPETPVPGSPLPGSPVPGTPEPGTPAFTPEPTSEPSPNPLTPVNPGEVTTLVTSTWTNIIPEQTTTYVIKFPLTTLATITVPRGPAFRNRLLRRQSSFDTLFPFSNSSITPFTSTEDTPLTSSITSELVTPTTTPLSKTDTSPSPFTENTSLMSRLTSQLETPISTPPPPTSTIPTSTIPTTSANTPTIAPANPSPTVCASGGDKVGNSTVTFDNLLPGPLLNPAGDLWFSEGFIVAPPSSPPSDAYLPSSGKQLLEFLPPALVPDAPFDGAGDTAEISVGPNERSPCFRFNFYGASLGCAAEGVEQWCEFEFSAYTYNETLGSEASLSWSETKRVPACPNFPQGPCPLTPVQLDGYNNLASILVSVRVGLELRAWWGDDLQIGWTDNTCEAASCRTNAISRRAKREVFSRASRRGVWQWTPNGVKKLDDDYIWSSFE
ncbi:hypothetical protein LLEC1_00573 [Akanthomyces lecanii]|uniref:DUF7371 domain-containing protein n=1 Tax=Cordyceps confragosa TaxID=2714763 RepID=A0A179I2F1_CORDF|nr:hypothetical protein LLEC1_00573 [Akanthomyces lecanii]